MANFRLRSVQGVQEGEIDFLQVISHFLLNCLRCIFTLVGFLLMIGCLDRARNH
jgi:hypothetical protein